MNTFLDPKPIDDEIKIEKSLRPQNFDEMIGRTKEKKVLEIMIKSAKQRGEPIDHVMFHGPPGLGKTSFANVIANEMNAQMHITSGPTIERPGDLASILTSLGDNDVLFIDEIHRLSKTVEEVLYPAMEDFAIDIMLGKGAGAKSVRIDLPKFTVIGATTKVGSVSAPLRDRFGTLLRLDFYSDTELAEMLIQKSKILNVEIDSDRALTLGKRSRGTARIAIRLLKRARDLASYLDEGITDENIEKCMAMLEIDNLGLDEMDRKILNVIINDFAGGPVGLSTISASLSEDVTTLEDMYEPYLIQLGFLQRTPKGRVATEKAYNYIGKTKIEKSTLF